MKKVIITFIMLAAAITAANAQFFVEGSVGVSHHSDKLSSGAEDPLSRSWFSVSPQVGYWLNDDIAVGTRVSFDGSIAKNALDDPNNPGQTIDRWMPRWEFSVFCRYKLWGTEKFSLLVDGSISAGTVSVKYRTTRETVSRTRSIGFSVHPAITYELTDRFSIIANLDFLRLGFISQTTEEMKTDIKLRQTRFNFSTQSAIFGRIGDIRIGFIYNF